MHLDLERMADADERRTEVCVIGAGAAGITAVRRLLAQGHEVTLLESGGLDHERRTAALNAGENIGAEYYPLRDARLRFFGGTTAIWGGRCATLDPIDLERRAWVPGSGWPLEWTTLERYYCEARPLFGLASEPETPVALAAAGAPLPDFDRDVLQTRLWSFDPAFDRFTFAACADLATHPRCTIVTHATVTEIRVDPDASHVVAVEAASLGDGRRLTVRPCAVVLAAGGIENARVLLASRSTVPQGLGNRHDQVGRYFMEHPHARGGRIVEGAAWPLLKAFARRHRVGGRDLAALIAPSPALQRERGILNTSLTIVARQPAAAAQFWGMRLYGGLKHDIAPTRAGRRLWMATKKVAGWAQRGIDPLRPWLLHRAGKLELALLVRAEQAPNSDSRITLSDDRDALGMPRVQLDWRFSDLDKRSVAVLVEALGGELARLGMGRVEPAAWLADPDQSWRTDPLVSSHPIGGYHHIGTTRMASDPRNGVVDGDGRVHGLGNLFVAGSSTFPTSSWANPTLTIAALALRTADRVSDMLRRPAAVPAGADA